MPSKNLKTSAKSNDNVEQEYPALSSGAIYLFSQVFNNANTIPGIIYQKEDFDNKEDLYKELLNNGYVTTNEVSDLGKELMVAIANMQQAEYALVLNQVAYFFDAKKINVTKVITQDNGKHALYHRQKVIEISAALKAIPGFNTDLEGRKDKIKKQPASILQFEQMYANHKATSIQIYRQGKCIYNRVVVAGDNSAIYYNLTDKTINEDAGRNLVKEVMKIIQIGVEFGFARYQKVT